jgi:hypothetical protein
MRDIRLYRQETSGDFWQERMGKTVMHAALIQGEKRLQGRVAYVRVSQKRSASFLSEMNFKSR